MRTGYRNLLLFLTLCLVTTPGKLAARQNGIVIKETYSTSCPQGKRYDIFFEDQCIAIYLLKPNRKEFFDMFDRNGQFLVIQDGNLALNLSSFVFQISANNFILVADYDYFCVFGGSTSLEKDYTFSPSVEKAYKVMPRKAFEVFDERGPKKYYAYYFVLQDKWSMARPFFSECIFGMAHPEILGPDEYLVAHHWINAPSTYLTSIYFRSYFLNQLERELKKCTIKKIDASIIRTNSRTYFRGGKVVEW